MNAEYELSKNLETIAKELDNSIEEKSGKRFGFALVVFSGERSSYISNIDRKTSIDELKRLINNCENEMPDISSHEIN